jgi:hypothetical protein
MREREREREKERKRERERELSQIPSSNQAIFDLFRSW